MPIFSRREFAEQCGVTPTYITQYIKRGKIKLDSNGNIDSSLPMNKDFMLARASKPSKAKTPKKELPDKKKPKAPPSPKEKVKPPNSNQPAAGLDWTPDEIEAMGKYQLEVQMKNLDLEKKEQEVEINKLKIQKLRGEVVPTDLVREVLKRHTKSLTTAFHQGADNFIMTITKISGMSREEMAGIRGELIEIVNKAVADAIDESKQEVDNIVNEYSQTRGRGEKK